MNFDIGEAVHAWMVAAREASACAEDVALAMVRPSVLYRPRIARDGDRWCALLGNNLADGVCGFGMSPAEAMASFDKAWTEKLHPSPAQGVKP